MIQFKSGTLSNKEKEEIKIIIKEIDNKYCGLYLTKNDKRIFFKEEKSFKLLFNSISNGNKIIWGEGGIILLTGFDDKSPRKYIRCLYRDLNDANKLFKVLDLHCKWDLWCKLRRSNLLTEILKLHNFKQIKGRGHEVLFYRKTKVNNLSDNDMREIILAKKYTMK